MNVFPASISSLLLAVGLGLAVLPAAQAQLGPIPRDVVQFTASATLEARQDQLSVTLRVTREGSDPTVVQQQLKSVLDAALAEARPQALPGGALEVRSGAFSLYPRSNRDGRISTWQGTAELILSGTEVERIAALSGRIQGMTVAQTAFGLSREQREKLEQQAQAQAIERFRARAGEIARGFGFSTYSLREININSQDQGAQIRPRFMAMEAKSSMAADAPLPVEAGQAQVQVIVSGSVQLK
jgi:predicted secreted protein